MTAVQARAHLASVVSSSWPLSLWDGEVWGRGFVPILAPVGRDYVAVHEGRTVLARWIRLLFFCQARLANPVFECAVHLCSPMLGVLPTQVDRHGCVQFLLLCICSVSVYQADSFLAALLAVVGQAVVKMCSRQWTSASISSMCSRMLQAYTFAASGAAAAFAGAAPGMLWHTQWLY